MLGFFDLGISIFFLMNHQTKKFQMFYCLLFLMFMAWHLTIFTFHIMSKNTPFYDLSMTINPYLVLIPLPFMTCFGICEKYPSKKQFGKLWYSNGNKRCIHCSKWVNWEGGMVKRFHKELKKFVDVFVPLYRCPCCNHKIRMHPRNSKHKEKHRKHLAEIIKATN